MTNIKTLALALAVGSALVLTGCKKKDDAGKSSKPAAGDKKDDTTAAKATDTAPASTGVPECDEYLAAFDKISTCDKLGPSLDAMKQSAEAQKEAWSQWKDLDEVARKAAQDAAGPGCKQSTEALKQSATAMGCEI